MSDLFWETLSVVSPRLYVTHYERRYILTKREIAACSVKSHRVCDCGLLCLPFDRPELPADKERGGGGRNAASFPDFLLINPGE